MNHIIIRTCPKDEFISMLCYESFQMAGIKGQYSFCAEDGNYKGLLIGHKTILREECNNFGGQLGVKGLLASLQKYRFEPGDTIIIADADIIIKQNFLYILNGYDHAGVGGIVRNLKHISGQLQVISYSLIEKLKSFTTDYIDSIVKEMIDSGYNIADDTFISYISDKFAYKKIILSDSEPFWIHEKFYQEAQSPNNIQTIIKTIINEG